MNASDCVCPEHLCSMGRVRLSQQSTGVRAGGEGRHTTCPGRALMTQGEKGKPKKVQTDGVMSDSTQTRELERSRRQEIRKRVIKSVACT